MKQYEQYQENKSSIFSLSNYVLGDNDLEASVYQDTYSNLIKIEPNTAYYLGEYYFEGKGILDAVPNLLIKKAPTITQDKLESFREICKSSYPTLNPQIVTAESVFNIDNIELSKTNALKIK